MDISTVIIALVVCFIFSVAVTGLLQKYALKHSLIDVPNERSSHSIPTPRGGGLSIVIPVLFCVAVLFLVGQLQKEIAIALGIGCLLVSIIGWVDDHKHVPALWRAIIYGIAAGLAMYFLGVFNHFQLGAFHLLPVLIGSALAVIWVMWMTNLYNFMDGTDGLAAIQAICVGFLAGILFWVEGQYGVAMVCFVILVSSCGFLFWNWPPAKIFMGDVGSCSLGFCFGVLAVVGEIQETVSFPVFFILLSIFICDAAFTLLMRIFANEKWYQAHKSHAYQRLVQMGASHKKLAFSILLINVVILWPMATMAFVWSEYSYYIATVSIFLMSIIWGSIQVRFHEISS